MCRWKQNKQKCVWLGGFLASKFEIRVRENAPKLLPALQNLPDMFFSFNFGLRNSATLLCMAYVCRKSFGSTRFRYMVWAAWDVNIIFR